MQIAKTRIKASPLLLVLMITAFVGWKMIPPDPADPTTELLATITMITGLEMTSVKEMASHWNGLLETTKLETLASKCPPPEQLDQFQATYCAVLQRLDMMPPVARGILVNLLRNFERTIELLTGLCPMDRNFCNFNMN